MSSPLRYAVPAIFVAIFLVLATVALDKPGYYYDEVIFVPVSLRVLGYCDVDAAVTVQFGCLPLLQTLGYVGAVKAWLHAPLFAVFGTNVWTVRLPSILIAAAALVVLWSFVRRELGGAWAALLLILLVTDPVLLGHARLDWGPQMIAAFLRVLALVALWRWLQTGRMHWLLTLCVAILVGFVDKINFIWVITAFSGAALVVAWRQVVDRLRSGWPWQPALAAVTAALLAWGVVTLVNRAAQLDILGDADTLSWSGQVVKVWNLFAATFSGSSVVNWVFGFEMPVTSAFNFLALAQFGAAVMLLARWRPWTPARRLLAFITAASVFLVIAIIATRQVGGTHHLVTIWPLPALHLVTLLAIAAQHGGGTSREGGRGFRASVAVTGAVVCGALLAWNIAITIRHVDAWRYDRDFRAPFDPAIAKLSTRLEELGVDRVISVDWGLHQQLVTLADRKRASGYREWTWRLIDATDLDRPDLRQAVAAHLPGKRVAFVLHTPRYTVFAGARARLDALLAREHPCKASEENIINTAGKPLYTIVVADYRDCGTTELPKY
ncbi:MAG: glycosyltransferase family 39 protein [Burkholderiales bacterium]|nr:glycosyltransferase family 39 protein [Burkholderiales bacterium]